MNQVTRNMPGRQNRIGLCSLREGVVPGAGLEPARPFGQEILSLQCLPIPPPGLGTSGGGILAGTARKEMEARVGIEPAYTALQAAA